MAKIQNGYTKNEIYDRDLWPDSDKIPIDQMWSSCAVGIVGCYNYEDPTTVILSVANAKEYTYLSQRVADSKGEPYSWRRTFLIFADGVGGRYSGGKNLADYILKYSLGAVTSLGAHQNLMYGIRLDDNNYRDHPCQCWLWKPDWPAIDKHAETLRDPKIVKAVKALF